MHTSSAEKLVLVFMIYVLKLGFDNEKTLQV